MALIERHIFNQRSLFQNVALDTRPEHQTKKTAALKGNCYDKFYENSADRECASMNKPATPVRRQNNEKGDPLFFSFSDSLLASPPPKTVLYTLIMRLCGSLSYKNQA